MLAVLCRCVCKFGKQNLQLARSSQNRRGGICSVATKLAVAATRQVVFFLARKGNWPVKKQVTAAAIAIAHSLSPPPGLPLCLATQEPSTYPENQAQWPT